MKLMLHHETDIQTNTIDIQKRIAEDNQIKTRSMVAEGSVGD